MMFESLAKSNRVLPRGLSLPKPRGSTRLLQKGHFYHKHPKGKVTTMPTDRTSILYSSIRSPHCLKAAMVLSEKGVPFQRVEVDLRTREQKSAAYLAINPLGQVPAYQDDQGIHYDSLEIMRHLDERYPEPRLFPLDPTLLQEVLSWIEFAGGRMRDVSHELYWQLLEPPAEGTDEQVVTQLKEEGTELLAQVEET